jgi:4-hydroxy-2-oxoglutarate aldolase
VISELSGHANIAGMKNSSSREISEYARAAGENKRFVFHAGRVSDLLRDFKQGVIGATLSMADYWPEDCIRLYAHLKQGMDDDAAELCMRIDSAGKAGASAYGVAGVKYAMDIAGFYGGEPRLPLQPLGDKQKRLVEKSFRLKEKSAGYEDIDRV